MLKLGLLGLGVAGMRHLAGLRTLQRQDIELTAIAANDPQRAELPPHALGATLYSDYRALIASDTVDAVIVALPHALHKEAAVYAAQHGKHVLLEKPIALTMADTDRVARAFADSGVRLMLGYVHRFREEVIVAKRMLNDGHLGQPASVLDRFCIPGDDLPAWVWDRERSGGGVLMYSGLHSVDRLRYLLGSEVVEVYARLQSYGSRSDCISIENGVAAMLTFENGVIASLVENMPPYELQYRYWDTEIFGTRGLLHIRTDDYLEFTGPDVSFKQSFRGYNHYARQLNEFVGAILDRRQPAIGIEDGTRSLAVALAIYRSAYVGRSVLVSNTD